MKTWRQAIRDGVISGGYASAISTAALSVTGKMETGSPYAATNAVSYILWGDKAAHHASPLIIYSKL